MSTVCLITKTHTDYVYLFLFHGNNGYAHAPQFYVYTYKACLYPRLHKINYLEVIILIQIYKLLIFLTTASTRKLGVLCERSAAAAAAAHVQY